MNIVLDTNVLVAGLRSASGASFAILERVGSGSFSISLSVPLVLEYEATLKSHARDLGLTTAEVDDFVDYICSVGRHLPIHYLWRPALKDPSDDMVLEVAVAGNADIVTHNIRDFVGSRNYGMHVYTPREFLKALRER